MTIETSGRKISSFPRLLIQKKLKCGLLKKSKLLLSDQKLMNVTNIANFVLCIPNEDEKTSLVMLVLLAFVM